MADGLSSVRQVTLTIDVDLAAFMDADAARKACPSTQDYIIALLMQERRRQADDVSQRKQSVNRITPSLARDMI